MVRRGGDGVRALGNHARAGDVRADLDARQVAADAGLGALAHLDFNRRAGVQVIRMHAEAAGGHLHDGVGAVLVEVLVQSALAGVVVGAQRRGRAGQGGVRVVGDGAVAHGGEHDRDVQIELRRHVVNELSVFVALDGCRLGAQRGARLHRLAQRVDGRVGDLRGIDEQLVPVDRIRLRIAHGGEQHAAGAGLTVDLGDGLAGPVGVLLEGVIGLDDLQRARGAQRHAAVAVHALALVAHHHAEVGIVMMHAVGALALAGAAGDAALRIADDLIGRVQKVDGHYA